MKNRYEIRIRGNLDPEWEEWFDGLEITHHGDETILSGSMTDQAALHGCLAKLRNLNLPLISINPIPPHAKMSHRSNHEEKT